MDDKAGCRLPLSGDAVGPLSGEKPEDSSVVGVISAVQSVERRRGRLAVVPGQRKQQQRGVVRPNDLRLRVALAPVKDLWVRLSHGQQAIAGRAALRALEVLAGIVDEEAAPQMLADRLRDRLAEVGGGVLVREPMAWLLGRGLVQRPACADPRCDDGIRLDTRSDCPTCVAVTADRRAVRARVRAELETGLGRGASQAVYEQRLQEHTMLEADRTRARHIRAAADVEQRRRAATRRRQQEEAAEQARRSAPCTDCGLPDAAGLCPPRALTRGARTCW